MKDVDDARLLDAWAHGDAEAGRELVRRHYRRVLLFFFSKVGPQLGRDLTQATFETLCTNKGDFRGDASFTTYLFGIARWKLVHHFRTERVRGQRFDPREHAIDLPAADRSVTSLFMGRQREALLVRALRSLPLDDQIVLELKEYEGLTSRQLAAIFDVGRDTMSSRINRARKRLTAAVTELAESAPLVDSTLSGLDDCMQQIRERMLAVGIAS